jgi:hypothetical protein
MFGKPPIYLIFIASFISITARRLRDLRLPVALVGAVPIMMLANFSFGITFGAPWSLSFTMGTGGEWPRYLFMALICVAFLCVMPTSSGYLDSEKRWGLAGVIALSILLLATLDAAFTILRGVSIWLYGVKGIIIPPLMLRYFSLYGLPVLLTGSLMLVAWQQRKQT